MFITRVGRVIGDLSDNTLHMRLAAAASTVIFGAIEFAVHEALRRFSIPQLADALWDALLVGVSFGLAVWFMLLGNAERRLRVRHDLERIAELNHEIRNALQVITDSQFGADAQRRAIVMQSVGRIDDVLKRIFPVVGGRSIVPAETSRAH